MSDQKELAKIQKFAEADPEAKKQIQDALNNSKETRV